MVFSALSGFFMPIQDLMIAILLLLGVNFLSGWIEDCIHSDGWKYRGRGYIQLTGRNNYLAYETSGFCNGKLTNHPEWLVKSPGRIKSAMWFWYKSGCNKLADADDIRTITRRINGGLNGLSDRQYYYRRAKRILML